MRQREEIDEYAPPCGRACHWRARIDNSDSIGPGNDPAADPVRCVRLEIKRIEMAGAAELVQKEDGLRPTDRRGPPLLLRAQQPQGIQTKESTAADLQQLAAGELLWSAATCRRFLNF